MILTPTDDAPTGAVSDQNPDRGKVSPLRQARDRGVTATDAPSTIDTHYPDVLYQSAHRHACPRCKGSVYRVPRRFVDLLLSVFVPVRRYRCDELGCSWEGNLRTTQRSPIGR